MKNLTTTEAIDFLAKYEKNTHDIWEINLNNLKPYQQFYFYNFIQLYLKKI
jgi:hypothetical protein